MKRLAPPPSSMEGHFKGYSNRIKFTPLEESSEVNLSVDKFGLKKHKYAL